MVALDSKVILGSIIGLLVILITTYLFVNLGSGATQSSKSPTFLIVGPSYSGKTSLYNHWTASSKEEQIETVTSQTANKFEQLKLPFGPEPVDNDYTIIDLPGHSKLWHFTANEIKNNRTNLVGIVYMIDGASGQKGISNAAIGLYKLLQLTERRAGGVSILIASNKSDLFNVISTNRLQSMLENEINELRNTQAQSVGEVKTTTNQEEEDEDSNSGSWIGLDGKDFEFSHLEGDVEILDGSVKASRTTKWETWLAEKALNFSG